MKISTISSHISSLGEGPVWDTSSQALYWVDSLGPTLFRFDYKAQSTQVWPLAGASIGSLAVRESGGLVLAMDQGFYLFSPESNELTLICEPLKDQAGVRFNDGKVDPFGAFLAGGMNSDHSTTQNCALYRLNKSRESEKLLDGFLTFNGPCFNTDGTQLYVTGRPERGIEMFSYHREQLPSFSKQIFHSPNSDGATIDEEGFLWTAQWSDECILRLTPDGKIDKCIKIPDQIVSSVMFGGPNLDLIYVTTVGAEVSDAIPHSQSAGQTIVIEDSGYKGRAENLFQG